MSVYDVYLSGTHVKVTAAESASLEAVRSLINAQIKADDYRFVYYNPVAKKKMILPDTSIERDQQIGVIALPDNATGMKTLVEMAVVAGNKTDLFGTAIDWLCDRNMGVRVSLNETDTTAIKANNGKFRPIMLTDITPSNANCNFSCDHAVICEKGTVVSFDVSSWGAAGFGYSIKSEKDTICDGLYLVFGNNPDHKAVGSLYRYQSSNNTIQIDSTEALNIPAVETIYYQKVVIKTWRLTSYKQDGKKYDSYTQPPTPTLAKPKAVAYSLALTGARAASTGTGYDAGTGGQTLIPGQDIQTGAPHRGPESGQTFGSISVNSEDDPNNTVLGKVVLYFFVFKDKDAANKVIKVLNVLDPNAFG